MPRKPPVTPATNVKVEISAATGSRAGQRAPRRLTAAVRRTMAGSVDSDAWRM